MRGFALFSIIFLLACGEGKVCTQVNGKQVCVSSLEAQALVAQEELRLPYGFSPLGAMGGVAAVEPPAIAKPKDFIDVSFNRALDPHRAAQTSAQKEGSMHFLVDHTVRWYGWVDNVYTHRDDFNILLNFRPWECHKEGNRGVNWVSARIQNLDEDEWASTALDLNFDDMVAVTCEVTDIRGEMTPVLENCTEISLIKRSPVKLRILEKDDDYSCEPNQRNEPWPPKPEVLRKAGFRAVE